MNQKRIIVIHGWGGTPQEGWLPWLKHELEKMGSKVFIPEMPDTKHPRMDPWLETLRRTAGLPDGNLILVGHSLGCITILRYLENLPERQSIAGAILVAGFSDLKIKVTEDEDVTEIESFFQTDVHFDNAKEHCKKFIAIHSDNDPYVSLRYADTFKEKLNAEIIVEHNMKHFSGDDGITKLEVLLDSIVKITRV